MTFQVDHEGYKEVLRKLNHGQHVDVHYMNLLVLSFLISSFSSYSLSDSFSSFQTTGCEFDSTLGFPGEGPTPVVPPPRVSGRLQRKRDKAIAAEEAAHEVGAAVAVETLASLDHLYASAAAAATET